MDVRKIIREEITKVMEGYYHGSPYEFDRFDISRIGTGDERSKFGWGLYFTDSPNTALQYAKDLSIGDHKDTGFNVYEVRLIGVDNYMPWDEQVPGVVECVIRELRDAGNEDDAQQLYDETSPEYGYEMWTGRELYEWLEYVAGGKKEASEFLYNNCDVYGIKGHTAWLEGNVYVAFSDDNIKILDHRKVS